MKKNLVKKAVLPALVALICSVVALTSVSYAWFTMGTSATVDEMELQVTTSDGLQVSSTGSVGTYKSLIPSSELKAIGTNKFPDEVSPVSTDGTVNAGNQVMFKGTIDKEGKLTAEATTADYIMFDLYIQTSANYTLILNEGSYVKSANSKDETHLAARVSFVNLGCKEKAAEAIALDGTGVIAPATIWEPNFKERAKSVKDNLVADNSTTALPYYGLNKAITTAMTLDDVNEADSGVSSKPKVLAQTYEKGATTGQGDLLSLGTGYNKIRVYVWLEGQDVDCVNEIAGGKLLIKLNLAVKTAPAPTES